MGKLQFTCDWCGKAFLKYPSQIKGKRHLFCSRKCLGQYSSKAKNPDGYDTLKDYTRISAHMTKLNQELNPIRMTRELRATMRQTRLNTGEGKCYPKFYGRAEHRLVASEKLGRELRPEEVVHHLDFNVRNSDPDNLMVLANGSAHAKYHATLRKFLFLGVLPTEPIEEVTV